MIEEPWFQILPDEELVSPIRPAGISAREYPQAMLRADFVRLQDRVGNYKVKRGMEICDFLFAPTFMVGRSMISLFRSLAPDVETKTLSLLPAGGQGRSMTYWLPYLPAVDCLVRHGWEYHVRPDCLRGRQIARYEGKRTVCWLFSLAAAEQILARGPMGIRFVRLPQVKEGEDS
ncbi:hypothetical protein SAMN02910356_00338 [Selenomonas sp. GACV-9]|uniref:hypothetical protein n=1 Tax=Selenomonas sp. GACV-9 TaxID=3158782 RepID=UPI0008E182EF|nr:hypothetical protein SAMN02910356_00338 [Selenomonas ruminantium]